VASRSSFQALGNKLINDTFADFRDPVTLAQVEYDYDTQANTTVTSDTTKGIRLEYKKSEFGGESIQVGDYKVLVYQQGLNTDVRADDVVMTFNGKAVSIINVSEDPARAVYTLQVRDK
tara:strand:- start:4793 stop:5149 length:357 start_codon:yes stop_codon:yes gene_type:complete